MSVVITKDYNAMVKSEELSGTTEKPMLQMSCCINWCHYYLVRLYIIVKQQNSVNSTHTEPGRCWIIEYIALSEGTYIAL